MLLRSPQLLEVLSVTVVAVLLSGRAAAVILHCWRMRWMVLALLLGPSFTIAGVPLWPDLGFRQPSIAGVQLGLLQAGKLLLTVMLFSILIASLPTRQLLCGLLGLLAPAGRLGRRVEQAVERFALHLVLIVEAVTQRPEGDKPPAMAGRAGLLAAVSGPLPTVAPRQVEVPATAFARRDYLAALLLFGAAAAAGSML